MTQNPALPVADPIPHCLAADLILDKAAGNWITWQKAVLACLTVVGLEGYVTGSVPCPDPASDPAGARNWQTNDRAVVSFLTFMVSRSEQPFVAGHAGAKAVWDALVARHFDPSPQIRLIREAFGVRYGGEPAAATSARIDVLATRIFALGPISKATLVSAMMVNAVQGDFSNLAEAGARASSSKQPQTSTAEQNAIAAITNEASTVNHELSPAVTAFVQNPSTNEAEWTRLLELLFQVLGRVDAIPLAPEWDRANAARQNVLADIQLLQNMLETSESNAAPDGENAQPRRVSEGEQNGLAAVATEMANVQAELAPAVTEYLQQQEPDPRQRARLIELLVQALVRLDGTSMHLDWKEGRTRRKRAVNEVLRLLNTLEWSPVSEPSPGHTLLTHTHTISPEEQGIIDVIAAELSNVQNVLAPAVATFPRSSALQTAQKERKYLSRLLFETVERLDATRINLDWEHARKERRGAVKTVEKLQNELDGLPTCTEEQNVITVIASERSKTQFLLLPAVTAYLGNPTERERLRLSELLSQALERLDGVTLESAWDQARTERKEAISEMQRLLDRLIIEPRAKTQEEQHALHLVTAELSRIQFLFTQAVNFFLEKPHEKERARLSELFMQTLERLDSIPVQQEWEEVLQVRRNAVHELQNLQSICDHPPSSTEIYTEHSAIAAIACERSKIQTELAPAILNFVRTSQPSTLATGTVAQASLNEKERLRLSELSLRLLERLDAVAIESAWDEARKERKSAVGEVQKLQDMLDVWGP